MKFFNGHWAKKPGVNFYEAKEIYEVRNQEDYMELIMPTTKIEHKGASLSTTNLTVRISTYGKGGFRLETIHYKGAKKKKPEYVLEEKPNKLQTYEDEDNILVQNHEFTLRIEKSSGRISLEKGELQLTSMGTGDLAYVRTEDKGRIYEDMNGTSYMRGATSLAVGEHIYGLGERFGAFVKNGQSIDIKNEDGGTSTDQAYKNIPFYISDRGYGAFVNHPETVSFEVGSENVGKTGFSVEGERLDFFLLAGDSMKDVLSQYTALTGRPALPPKWSFGLWLSTSFTTNYNEDTVMGFLDEMEKQQIPLSVFHFDCFWMKGMHWTNFLWDDQIFPDPQKMIDRIHSKGLKVCVWINPYIAQASELFDEGMDNGYLLKRINGDVWQWDEWQAGLGIVDFTNPAARSWYQEQLKKLLGMGVDCFKTDFGERIPMNDVNYFDGSDSKKMHNYYSYLYNESVYQTVKEVKGEKDALVFARSATTGCQKFPVHWGGDCMATYESMAESLRGGLSLTMSGFGYWSHDIGGFEDTSTPDLYKRWVAFGLMSTHSRLHGSSSYRVPWNYDAESVEVLRHFTKVKKELEPYIIEQAKLNHETGIPVMRAMALEFPEDKNCTYLDRQYMLGDRYLVAPVFNPEGLASYYLPEGAWVNYFTKEIKQGGCWYEEYVDYFTIPCFYRQE